MKKYLKILFLILSFVFLLYLAIPNPIFPSKLPDALQSNEPADTETTLRRAYFTNYEREQALNYYTNEFKNVSLLNLNVDLFTYRLNYPPEEAQTIVRDQTRSTFLEEIVHPMRESLFVNGFKAQSDKDTIFIDGKVWVEKLTVRFVSSNVFVRLAIGALSIMFIKILFSEWESVLGDARKVFKKIWTYR